MHEPAAPRRWRALVADPRHGSLPALLLALTLGSGIVDAVSILSLGRVFVANMTGNVAFIGFAIAGAPGFSMSASIVALAGFLAGALAGGSLGRRLGERRVVLLAAGASAELLLVGGAVLVARLAGEPFANGPLQGIAALCAVAMGLQNAVARRIAVPDLTTSVLTMALTGIAADRPDSSGGGPFLRRSLAALTMLAGAFGGAEIVLHTGAAAALETLWAVIALVSLASVATRSSPASPSPAS